MQITVRSEIENRIDESNSTAARMTRERVWRSMPCVESVGGVINKKGERPVGAPALLGVKQAPKVPVSPTLAKNFYLSPAM